MEFKTLSLEKKCSIALLKFVRPEVMNAFNSQQVDEMKLAVTNLAGDKEIRVVILSGEGKAFTSGADLSEKEAKWENVHDALIEGYLPSLKGIIEMPKLVIASINGPAAGIGAAFAMACDFRVMSEDSYILSVFSNIALVPDGGLNWLLARNIGYTKALEYAVEAKKISASECLEFGIANKVCSLNDLDDVTFSWAKKLSERSPQAVANTKKLMRESLEKKYLETFEDEAKIQVEIFGNEEFKEGVSAFFAKRKPNFQK